MSNYSSTSTSFVKPDFFKLFSRNSAYKSLVNSSAFVMLGEDEGINYNTNLHSLWDAVASSYKLNIKGAESGAALPDFNFFKVNFLGEGFFFDGDFCLSDAVSYNFSKRPLLNYLGRNYSVKHAAGGFAYGHSESQESFR